MALQKLSMSEKDVFIHVGNPRKFEKVPGAGFLDLSRFFSVHRLEIKKESKKFIKKTEAFAQELFLLHTIGNMN